MKRADVNVEEAYLSISLNMQYHISLNFVGSRRGSCGISLDFSTTCMLLVTASGAVALTQFHIHYHTGGYVDSRVLQ